METITFSVVFEVLMAGSLGWVLAQTFLTRHRLRRLEAQLSSKSGE
jgi:hypothetical protein